MSTIKSFTFNSFIGENNLKAEIISNSIDLRKPKYNPIFIYGAVATGKTHFTQGIYNCFAEHCHSSKIAFWDCGRFLQKNVESILNNTNSEYVDSFMLLDLLIIDSIHLLGGKEKSQNVLLQIVDALYLSNKQLVFTSNCPPNELADFIPELKSRMLGGLRLEFCLPDYHKRFEILKLKAQQLNLKISDENLKIIAEKENLNGRTLEAVLVVIMYKCDDLENLKKEYILKLLEHF